MELFFNEIKGNKFVNVRFLEGILIKSEWTLAITTLLWGSEQYSLLINIPARTAKITLVGEWGKLEGKHIRSDKNAYPCRAICHD